MKNDWQSQAHGGQLTEDVEKSLWLTDCKK